MNLHLGCGDRFLPGYVHVDINNSEHIDYCHTIETLPMIESDSVSIIYSCGALVYFDRFQIPGVLTEWKRVLKSGGTLRLSVPDFESIVSVYSTTGDLNHQGILGPIFGRWKIIVDGENKYIYQKTTYDFKSMSETLYECGFTHVSRYRWQDVMPEDYDDYSMAYIPHMDSTGRLISLNIEATKP